MGRRISKEKGAPFVVLLLSFRLLSLAGCMRLEREKLPLEKHFQLDAGGSLVLIQDGTLGVSPTRLGFLQRIDNDVDRSCRLTGVGKHVQAFWPFITILRYQASLP